MKFIVQSETTENLLTTNHQQQTHTHTKPAKWNYINTFRNPPYYIKYHKLPRLLFSCKKKLNKKKIHKKISNRTHTHYYKLYNQ